MFINFKEIITLKKITKLNTALKNQCFNSGVPPWSIWVGFDFFFKHIASPSYASNLLIPTRPSARWTSLAFLPWKKMELSEGSHLMCVTMNFHWGRACVISEQVFLFNLFSRGQYLLSKWVKECWCWSSHGRCLPGQTAATGDVRGQGCCPCGCPVGHCPDPWPLGPGTAHGGTNSCAWHGPKAEEKSGICSGSTWEKSWGDERCEGWPVLRVPCSAVTLRGLLFWGLCVIITLVFRKLRGQFHLLYSSFRAWQWFQSPSTPWFALLQGRLMQAITWGCDGNGFHSVSCEKTPGVSAKPRASCQVNLCVSIFLICADTESPQTSLSFQSCWDKIPAFLWPWKSLQVQSGALGMHTLCPSLCATGEIPLSNNECQTAPAKSVLTQTPKENPAHL